MPPRAGRKAIQTFARAGRNALLRPVKLEQSGAQSLRQFHHLEIPDPARAAFNPGNGKPIHIPSLPLTTRGEFFLRQAELVA